MGFFLFVLAKKIRTDVYDILKNWSYRLLVGGPKCRHNVLPSFAPQCWPPCSAPTQHAVCVSQLWIRQVLITRALGIERLPQYLVKIGRPVEGARNGQFAAHAATSGVTNSRTCLA